MSKTNPKDVLNYLMEIEQIKRTVRWVNYDKSYHESVADHCCCMTMLAVQLIDAFDLRDLDFQKVIRMCLYHDMGELHLAADVDSFDSQAPEVKTQKDAYEHAVIADLVAKFGARDMADVVAEYEARKTAEAKFVKALDKLESRIHVLNCAETKIMHPQFSSTLANQYIADFPRLKPFYHEIQLRMKQRVIDDGFEWDEAWFLS